MLNIKTSDCDRSRRWPAQIIKTGQMNLVRTPSIKGTFTALLKEYQIGWSNLGRVGNEKLAVGVGLNHSYPIPAAPLPSQKVGTN